MNGDILALGFTGVSPWFKYLRHKKPIAGNFIARSALLFLMLLSVGCVTTPPKNLDNVCEIFREKSRWYDDAADARKRWGSPIPIMMAIMHQESRFRAKAKPPRTKLFGFIPWLRPSSAYGYSQAKDSTWDWYRSSSGHYGADRDDFDDAIDFIGWYNKTSIKQCNIRANDAYHLYLAYHEGHGGFNRRTFRKKQWLKNVAKKVSSRAKRYDGQLKSCEAELKRPWWRFF